VDCGSHDKMKSLSTPREWRAGMDELSTRSINSAVDRSRDLSAFRPLIFHCTSGSRLTHTVDNVAFHVR